MLGCTQFYLFFSCLLIFIQPNGSASRPRVKFSEQKFYHKSVNLVGDQLLKVASLSDNLTVFNKALKNILVPRVVGTENHKKVQQFITQELTNIGWSVEYDTFKANTPLGQLQFKNIIAYRNPKAKRFLDIACHYDSKYFPGTNHFVGATDSAVPCAMMIQLAYSLDPLLKKVKQNEVSLRLIFFDGEEAFKSWSKTDSLYGSRHLAELWNSTPYPEVGEDATQLDRIDILVLLDLLGASSPTFYSFFSDTQGWYKVLANAETKLARGNALKNYSKRLFQKMSTDGKIEDDHLPFIERDVPVLHIIPLPFPTEWHTPQDNMDIIDMQSVDHIVKIMSIFIVEYLHLGV